MPGPFAFAGLQAGAQLLGGAINANSQKNSNASARRHANRQAALANRHSRRQQRRALKFQARVRRGNRLEARRVSRIDWLRNRRAVADARRYSASSIQRMAKDARAAGLSPTLFGSGGRGPGNIATSASAPAVDQSNFPTIPYTTAGSSYGGSTGVGDGIMQAAAALTPLFDLEERGLRNDLLRAQIGATRMSMLNAGRSAYGAMPRSGPGSRLDPRTSYNIAGFTVEPHPLTSDVETIARRLGEPAEWLAAPIIGALDYKFNYKRLKGHVHKRLKARGITRNKFGTYQFFKP